MLESQSLHQCWLQGGCPSKSLDVHISIHLVQLEIQSGEQEGEGKRVGSDHIRHLGGVLYYQPHPLQKNGLVEGEVIKLQSFRFPHLIRGEVQSDRV